jgi:hypothetical protein
MAVNYYNVTYHTGHQITSAFNIFIENNKDVQPKNAVFWDMMTPCGAITAQKTAFFIFTIMKTSNLT